MKKMLGNLIIAYLAIGGFFASISLMSSIYFHSFGPAAVSNVGILTTLASFVFSIVSMIARMVLWPYGIYIVITTDMGFFEWLFYLWYTDHQHPAPQGS